MMFYQEESHKGGDSDMLCSRDVRSGLQVIHSVLQKPMEDLDECRDCKHRDKSNVELLAEYRHR